MALAVVANYSCGEYDNPVDENGTETITDADGNELTAAATLQVNAEAGDELTATIEVSDNDKVALKSGDNVAEPAADGSITVEVDETGVVEVLTNSDIVKLTITDAKLTSIDLGEISTLEYVDLSDNELTDIDLSNNYDLTYVDLSGNQLTSVDLKNNFKLEYVDLSNNQLTTVGLSNAYDNLLVFKAANNQLTEFDAAKMRKLKTLDLSNNQIAGELNLVAPEYDKVNVSNNQLTAVKVAKVTDLDVSNNNLLFSTLPLPTVVSGTYVYAPQNDYTPAISGGILDLSAEKTVGGNDTAYDTNLEDGVDFDENEFVFAFVKTVNDKIELTNATFPGLTITVNVATAAADNTIFAWTQDYITYNDANIKAVRSKDGTDEDNIDYIHYKKADDPFLCDYYDVIRVNGTKQSIEGGTTSPKRFNYILVEFDEPLQVGNVLKFTGFRRTNVSANANLYLLFDLKNDNKNRVYNDYRPGDELTQEYTFGEIFPNIWENGVVPGELTLIVDKSIAGSKSFKIARNNEAETEIYLTNIEILRR